MNKLAREDGIQIIGEPVDELSRKCDEIDQHIPRDINEALIKTSLPDGLKLIIHTKEDGHNRPHFHIKKAEKEAVYRIDKFELLDGDKQIYSKYGDEIKSLWKGYAQDLLCIWNESRSSDRGHQKSNCGICGGIKDCSYEEGKYASFTSKGITITIGD